MTRYTEQDLRTVFAEVGDGGPERPQSPRLEKLVRRSLSRSSSPCPSRAAPPIR
ncbi:hypothetical protein [Nonomuraea sp. SBT364]|uniref:hypothetical protein n=1 Tax=Nonomuraea sp. SBT364 TaxID=1580530 RepID=UPI0012E18C2D|nr:hypothetical protein [Nonomuraea sp. SBT364]